MALDRPLAGSPQAALLEPAGRGARHDAARRRHRAGVGHHLPQRDRGLGPARTHRGRRSRRCTGCLSASTCPTAPSSRTWPTSPACRPTPSPGTAPASCARPPDRSGLLVSFEVFYAGRSHASVRAGAELLVVPTNTSSYSTSQVPAQEIAAAVVQAVQTGRDLVQAAPTGYSAVVDQPGRRRRAQRPRPAPGARGHRRAAPRHDALRPLGRPAGAGARGAGLARRRLGPPGCATRSSPSGCRRRGRRPPRTWRGWTDRPRRRAAGRTRGPGGPPRPSA